MISTQYNLSIWWGVTRFYQISGRTALAYHYWYWIKRTSVPTPVSLRWPSCIYLRTIWLSPTDFGDVNLLFGTGHLSCRSLPPGTFLVVIISFSFHRLHHIRQPTYRCKPVRPSDPEVRVYWKHTNRRTKDQAPFWRHPLVFSNDL